ncbi:MAG TPA: two-component regulator propeller domain-containing protein, partial [Flavisolibacter sp.]|nr:two-component regulator propeller domain-containing protein [Flavisolibacter sp.]
RPVNNDPASLSHRMVDCFAENKDGDIWIGTDGGGLNLFHRKTGKFTHLTNEKKKTGGIQSNTILSLLKSTKDGGIWIGSYDAGLSYYVPKTNSFIYYSKGKDSIHLSDKAVYALMEDNKGQLWIGTNEGGINVLDRNTQTFTKFLSGPMDGDHLSNNCIRALYQHTDGNVWIGTYNSGINIYNPITKRFTYLDKRSSNISNDIVFCIHRDNKGNIWVGTMGGLNLYDEKKQRFISFTEENGLANNVINSIQEDIYGYLWLSTKKGISRFDPLAKKFKNYSLYNGLQSYEFLSGSGFKSSTGEIYFGGVNGFNVFNPEKMPENFSIPPVVITDFQLFNATVPIGEESPLSKHISVADSITLPFGKSVMSFEFAALDYTISEKNQYAYMLE